MPLIQIEPETIGITPQIPISFYETQAYYLGFGRNAWHSTWVNKYYQNCVSFSADDLKKTAESLRKQGNVFKIESRPMIVFSYRRDSFGILPINDKSASSYDGLLRKLVDMPAQEFWRIIPDKSENWLLVFRIPFLLYKRSEKRSSYKPSGMRSYSNGVNYHLGWTYYNNRPYDNFINFYMSIIDRFTK